MPAAKRGPGRPSLGEKAMSPAERKRLERQRTVDADKVRIEVKLSREVFQQLEQLLEADQDVSRDELIEAAIVAAFGQRPRAQPARSVFDLANADWPKKASTDL